MQFTVWLEARAENGETASVAIARWHRCTSALTADEVGLSLAEGKALLAAAQRAVVGNQIDGYVTDARRCTCCGQLRKVHDRRTRTLQTLFGIVEVDAPRLKPCGCQGTDGQAEVISSPTAQLLSGRSTPELQRVQAELGARHSFREAARLLSNLLPCSRPNHATLRNRLHRAAVELEAEETTPRCSAVEARTESPEEPDVIVLIDGAHIRAAPGFQTRHIDVTVGKVEVAGRPPRRFAVAPRGADRPLMHLRAALTSQGWQPGRPVTVISDGEAVLPELIRATTGEPVAHIPDWWHISMRVRHAEQALRGVYALQPEHCAGLDIVDYRLGRVRHLLWNGYYDEARRELFGLQHLAGEAVYLNGEGLRRAVGRFLWHCEELRGYLANNETALIEYGSRYRAGLPISTSRAESCVDEIANARMAKQQRMRWSPCGAHRVALVRAAVLDGRLGQGRQFQRAA